MFGGETELRFRTHHSAGDHPADAGLLQLAGIPRPRIGQHRALRGERNVLSGGHVRGAADDRLPLPALVHRDQPQPVRVRMGPYFQDPPDDHPLPVAAGSFDVRYFEPGQGQPVRQGLHVFRQRHHRFEPPKGDAHGTDSSNERQN